MQSKTPQCQSDHHRDNQLKAQYTHSKANHLFPSIQSRVHEELTAPLFRPGPQLQKHSVSSLLDPC